MENRLKLKIIIGVIVLISAFIIGNTWWCIFISTGSSGATFFWWLVSTSVSIATPLCIYHAVDRLL